MNKLFYILIFIISLYSCRENVKMDSVFLITKSYLDIENREYSDLYYREVKKLIEENSITKNIFDDIIITKVQYGDGSCFTPRIKTIIYIKSRSQNFEYSFGSDEEICFNDIGVICSEPIFSSRVSRCSRNPLYQNNINYILKRLKINSIENAKKIVEAIFSNKISNIDEFQFNITKKYFKDIYLDSSLIICCKKAVENFEKDNLIELKNDNIEFYQSQYRGIWRIQYLPNRNGIVSIKTSYLLSECLKVHPLGFSNYRERCEIDSMLQEWRMEKQN